MTDRPLSGAYGEPPEREAVKRRLRAESWRFDPQIEHLNSLIERGAIVPTASQRMELGYYQVGKEAARDEGMDTTGGDAA